MNNNELIFAKVRPEAIIPIKREEDAGRDLYACFNEDYILINPLETKLVAQAKSLGMTGVNGLEMLVAQALYAVEFFLDTTLDEAKIDEVYKKIYQEKSEE